MEKVINTKGESYKTLLRYFYQEFITAIVLFWLIGTIDSLFIVKAQATSSYTTLGITNTLIHLIAKIGEAFSVGMMILCGQYNGLGEYKEAGKSVVDAFWATCITGSIIAFSLYFGAHYIYAFYEVPPEIVSLGVPFLKLRSIGVFFSFICFALIGFLRGVKNTKVPMVLSVLGSIVFVVCDYIFIFGKFGFTPMGIQGSALAAVIQFFTVFLGAILYILFSGNMKKYAVQLFSAVRFENIKNLFYLSWPVMFDKAALAFCQIWLAKMVGLVAKAQPLLMSKTMLASFVVLNDISRLSIMPGIACAQIITFLVSNDYQLHRWSSIRANIRKIFIISFIFVFGILGIFSLWPKLYLQYMDPANTFSDFASAIIPVLNIYIFFDLLQLILAGALRGATQVKVVMWVRMVVVFLFIVPGLYFVSNLTIANIKIHFAFVYGFIHIGNAIMGIIYIYFFRKNFWKKISIEEL